MATVDAGNTKGLFSIAITQGVKQGTTLFIGLLHYTIDWYLIMMSVKQGRVKYYFLRLWYDSTRDSTPVSLLANTHTHTHTRVHTLTRTHTHIHTHTSYISLSLSLYQYDDDIFKEKKYIYLSLKKKNKTRLF